MKNTFSDKDLPVFLAGIYVGMFFGAIGVTLIYWGVKLFISIIIN